MFTGAVANGGQVKAINVKGGDDNYSRKDIDALAEFAEIYGAKGLAWLKVEADGLKGPIAKFFMVKKQQKLVSSIEAEVGDLILFVADKKTLLRMHLARFVSS